MPSTLPIPDELTFGSYPVWKKLGVLKDEHLQRFINEAMFIQCDLRSFELRFLETTFDVILIDPPLEE